MTVVSHINWETRKIYLKQWVTTFSPVEDIYKEVREMCRTDDSLQKREEFITAWWNIPKGWWKATPRYAVLMQGCKIVPYDEAGDMTVDWEIITDNPDVDPTIFDLSEMTQVIKLFFKPVDAEIIYITSWSWLSTEEHNKLMNMEDEVWTRSERTLTSWWWSGWLTTEEHDKLMLTAEETNATSNKNELQTDIWNIEWISETDFHNYQDSYSNKPWYMADTTLLATEENATNNKKELKDDIAWWI